MDFLASAAIAWCILCVILFVYVVLRFSIPKWGALVGGIWFVLALYWLVKGLQALAGW